MPKYDRILPPKEPIPTLTEYKLKNINEKKKNSQIKENKINLNSLLNCA